MLIRFLGKLLQSMSQHVLSEASSYAQEEHAPPLAKVWEHKSKRNWEHTKAKEIGTRKCKRNWEHTKAKEIGNTKAKEIGKTQKRTRTACTSIREHKSTTEEHKCRYFPDTV